MRPPEFQSDPALVQVHSKAVTLRQTSAVKVVGELLDHAITVAKADAGCMYLLSADGQSLRQAVSRNIHPELMVVELRVGQGVSGMAAADRASQRIDHYRSHPLAREPFLSHDLQAVLACPILFEDQLLGVLTVTSHAVGHRFGAWEVRAVELVSFHLAMVMRTAPLAGIEIFAS